MDCVGFKLGIHETKLRILLMFTTTLTSESCRTDQAPAAGLPLFPRISPQFLLMISPTLMISPVRVTPKDRLAIAAF
jgi:hypothetical protein